MHLTVEMDKVNFHFYDRIFILVPYCVGFQKIFQFLLVSFNANILAVFEFSDQKIAVHGTYQDVGILQQKRIFRDMFDAPLMTIASHSLGRFFDPGLWLAETKQMEHQLDYL